MVRKSRRSRRESEWVETAVVSAVLASLVLGLLASAALTARALRPLAVLGAGRPPARRGRLAARVRVAGGGGRRSRSWPATSTPWPSASQRYRPSSLGELLQAQQAAQAAIDSLPDPVLVLRRRRRGAQRQPRRRAAPAASGRADADPRRRPAGGARDGSSGCASTCSAGAALRAPRGLRGGGASWSRATGTALLLPRATPVYGEEGQLLGATVVLQDVTRLRRFDELKNDLVATVAHEFRTPLTSLRMAIHLCAEQTVGPLDEKQADLLLRGARGLRAAAGHRRRAARPVADPGRPPGAAPARGLDRARSSSRRATPPGSERSAADPGGGRHPAGRGGGDGRSRPDRPGPHQPDRQRHPARPPGRPVVVRATRRRRRQCASRSGRRSGHRARVPAAPLREVLPGPGRRPGGAGLGLSIVRDVVEAHGGTVGVESAPGKGTLLVRAAGQPDRRRRPRGTGTRDGLSSVARRLALVLLALAPERRGVDARGSAPPRPASACGPSRAGCARARSRSSVKSPPSAAGAAWVAAIRSGKAAGGRRVRGPEDHRALDRVAQLAHVARPRVALEHRGRLRRQLQRPAGGRDGGERQETAGQGQDVLPALAQRRHAHLDHVQPVEQVLAEPPGAARRPRGRGWWPRRCARRRGASASRRRARTAFSWRKRSSLRLRGGASSADLVEEQRAALGRLDAPGLSRTAPVKAPRAWPNSSLASSSSDRVGQLTVTNGRSRARCQPVQRPRQHALAGPVLAAQQHRGVRGRGPRRSDERRPHRRASGSRASPPDPRRPAGPRALHPARGAGGARASALDHGADLRRGEGLGQVVARAAAHRLHRGVDGGVGGDDHHVEIGPRASSAGSRSRPLAVPSRRSTKARSTGAEASARERRLGRAGLAHLAARPSRHTAQRRADVLLVVDDEDPVRGGLRQAVLGCRLRHDGLEVAPLPPRRHRRSEPSCTPALTGRCVRAGAGACSAGAETVSTALAWRGGIPARVRARSVVVPGASARSRPRPPGALDTPRMAGASDDQTTSSSSRCSPPPDRVAVATAVAACTGLERRRRRRWRGPPAPPSRPGARPSRPRPTGGLRWWWCPAVQRGDPARPDDARHHGHPGIRAGPLDERGDVHLRSIGATCQRLEPRVRPGGEGAGRSEDRDGGEGGPVHLHRDAGRRPTARTGRHQHRAGRQRRGRCPGPFPCPAPAARLDRTTSS